MMDQDSQRNANTEQDTTTAVPSQAQSPKRRQKLQVYNEVLRRLKNSDNHEAMQPDFDLQLWAHFDRLPTRLVATFNFPIFPFY